MAPRLIRGWLEEGEDLRLILVISRCLFLCPFGTVPSPLGIRVWRNLLVVCAIKDSLYPHFEALKT
jgi:hypothetical protein